MYLFDFLKQGDNQTILDKAKLNLDTVRWQAVENNCIFCRIALEGVVKFKNQKGLRCWLTPELKVP